MGRKYVKGDRTTCDGRGTRPAKPAAEGPIDSSARSWIESRLDTLSRATRAVRAQRCSRGRSRPNAC